MRSRFVLWFVALAVVATGIVSTFGPQSTADEKSKPPISAIQGKDGARKAALKVFMRKKLDASQDVLEGLAVEDFELILRGAKQLKATGTAAEFMVHNDALYAEYAGDFRRTVDKLERHAKEGKLDGAALAYVDLTLNCVECHKYVRNILVARH